LATRRRTATSFSTVRSSKVCGVNWSLRRVLLQIGHGAGPRVNSRSMHDSHLMKGHVSELSNNARVTYTHFVITGRADQHAQFGIQKAVRLTHRTLVIHALRVRQSECLYEHSDGLQRTLTCAQKDLSHLRRRWWSTCSALEAYSSGCSRNSGRPPFAQQFRAASLPQQVWMS
jgi:hypothetical protein